MWWQMALVLGIVTWWSLVKEVGLTAMGSKSDSWRLVCNAGREAQAGSEMFLAWWSAIWLPCCSGSVTV